MKRYRGVWATFIVRGLPDQNVHARKENPNKPSSFSVQLSYPSIDVSQREMRKVRFVRDNAF